ncbi:MAG: SufE family protein [Pedosphaera sp.]|nr:SufE family protein [Pedosphaera sp.]MSU42824.1 SufE family protein [Pedosphaera sp.]
MTLEELAANFEALGDWEARFGYLIDLGRELPPMAAEDKSDAYRVHGCQAQVWMKFIPRPTANGLGEPVMDIAADSDAFIVKGLIAVLLMLYSGKTAAAILRIDGVQSLARLQLAEHLSPTRKNGLGAMLKRIRELATAQAAACTY